MSMRADCRKCMYFAPIEQLDEEKKRKLEKWVEMYRPNEKLLGYCRYFERPVTYYEGSCWAYRKKESISLQQRKLFEYLKQ